MTNRILPETLPALYRQYNRVPVQGLFSDIDGRMCGIGISTRALNDRHMSPYAAFEDVLDISREYCHGYTAGWDGGARRNTRETSDYDLGYADGAAGWAAVKDLAVRDDEDL